MILKAALAMMLAPVSASAHPQVAPPWQFAVDTQAFTETGIDPSVHPEVVRVDCIGGRGSAFKIGPHLLVSVAHVTNIGGCFINGEPIKVLRTKGDFALLYSDNVADKWLTVDCGGFQRGHSYIATGFARGLPIQTTIDIVDTGTSLGGFERLWGVFTVIPGQSGGAITDRDTGKVVGTINVYQAERGDSGSIPLKDTSICQS